MKKIGVGIIGLGARGYYMVEQLCGMDNYEILAVCDTYEDRTDAAAQLVKKLTGKTVMCFTDHHGVFSVPGLDAVLIVTGWESHFPIALEALKLGIPVGCEVGGAYSVEDCFELVKVQRETKTPFMLLENCCYGRYEMLVMNMVKLGLFGEVISCEGGYRHDLRTEVLFGAENRHYRLENYKHRNCENYPTHDLGPIAQILDINRSNRFVSLHSFATKAAGLNDYAVLHEDVNRDFVNYPFSQGDVVKTVIKCSQGQLVTLTLDTTLPRPYSRGFVVQGTRGMYCEDGNYVYLDTDFTVYDHFDWIKHYNNAEEYLKKYEHPVWEKFLHDGVRGGHGGMDYLVYNEFAECLIEGRPFPITVEDAAAWMAVTPLSAQSIKEDRTVEFPDFCK